MNSKTAFLLLCAVLLIVSQMIGEDSTIASLASSDDSEIQQTLEQGEAAIKRAASGAGSNNTTSVRSAATQQSETLDNFYGQDSLEEDPAISAEETETDADTDATNDAVQTSQPSAVASARARAAPSQSNADRARGQVVRQGIVEPFAQPSAAELSKPLT